MLGWQESYLDNSDHSTVSCMPDDIPTLAPIGTIAYDLGTIPSSSLWLVAMPRGTLVPVMPV
jgi:hypothetical protein